MGWGNVSFVMDPIHIVLNTRHGTLASPTAFNACRWALPDPIMAPPDHALFVSVTFVALPGDHHRINDFRGTTALRIESRLAADPSITEVRELYVPSGSYTRLGFVQTINKAFEDNRIPAVLELMEERADFILRTQEVQLWSISDEVEHRILPSPQFNAAESLGYFETSVWATSKSPAIPNSVMDTQGTRTITIQGRNVATPAADPVEMTRRRSVLAVIPAPNNVYNQSWIWERQVINPSFIPSRHLCIIELSLFDDMGKPVNPNHHWSIGIEITARKREYFVSNM